MKGRRFRGGLQKWLRTHSMKREGFAEKFFRQHQSRVTLRPESTMTDLNKFAPSLMTDDLQTFQKWALLNELASLKGNHSLKSVNIAAGSAEWNAFILKEFPDMQIRQAESQEGLIINRNADGGIIGYVSYYVSQSVQVDIHDSAHNMDAWEARLTREYSIVKSYIDWVYDTDGSSTRITMNTTNMPIAEMYPFLGQEKLDAYYDRFMASSANILLLIGPPGTGKTTFLRGLIDRSSCGAVVTYDADILRKDNVFSYFIDGSAKIMILEDCDEFLSSRKSGNGMMHKFLNIGDGLATLPGKKLIFSTNLPSIKNVDTALVRPGRCFDVLQFNHLTPQQASKVASKLGIEYTPNKADISLAELLNPVCERISNPSTVAQFGFG